MAKLRSVSTAFWSDPFIEELTPNEKLLFLYLITNEKTNMLGIYESSVKKISFETGIKKDDIISGLESFKVLGKVKYINNYVILVNYIKHQNFNTNMKKSAIDIFNNIPKGLIDNNIPLSKENPLKSFETLSNRLGMVRKGEVETKDELEDEDEDEIFINNKEFSKNLISNQQWIETICMQQKIQIVEVQKYLDNFDQHLITSQTQHHYQKDYSAHFTNWISIKLQKEKSSDKKESDNLTASQRVDRDLGITI